MDRKMPIAVTDSGLGGLTVLKEMVNLMPNEDFLYLGDTKNAPYGTKSEEEVKALTVDTFNYFKKRGIKAFVIACNTATSASVSYLREQNPDMIIIGVEPALKPAVLYKENSKIAVLATPLTLRLNKFNALLDNYRDRAEIIPFPCPGIVEFVEKGIIEGEEIDGFVKELLSPLKEKNIDSVVLGCTHYPLIKESIKKALGEEVKLFDGSFGTAKHLLHRLLENNLNNDENHVGKVEIIDSSYNSEKTFLMSFGEKMICK